MRLFFQIYGELVIACIATIAIVFMAIMLFFNGTLAVDILQTLRIFM